MSNCQIRKNARESLGNGIFSQDWLMAVVAVLVYSLISGVLGSFYVGIIFIGCFAYGYAGVFLDRVRGKDIELAEMFTGFKRFSDTLSLGLLQYIYTFLWTLLFIIPGIIKAYSYSMSFYVMKDHPEYTPSQCITESRRLMHGKKFKLFLLDLSFIGWAFVCLFTFGIGSLWLSAYMSTSHAHFYLALLEEDNAQA